MIRDISQTNADEARTAKVVNKSPMRAEFTLRSWQILKYVNGLIKCIVNCLFRIRFIPIRNVTFAIFNLTNNLELDVRNILIHAPLKEYNILRLLLLRF